MPNKNKLLYEIQMRRSDYHDPTPEQKLCFAVLERAVLDATGNLNGASKHIQREAIQWFDSMVDQEEVMSFTSICELLSINNKKLKQYIKDCLSMNLQASNKYSFNRFLVSILED